MDWILVYLYLVCASSVRDVYTICIESTTYCQDVPDIGAKRLRMLPRGVKLPGTPDGSATDIFLPRLAMRPAKFGT